MMEIINMDGDMRDPKFVAQLSTAEEFLSTIVQDGPRTHISWGMTFLERIEGDRSMRPDVLENAAIYYRSTLGPHLFVNDNGVVPIANDGKTLRKLGQESLGMLDPQKRGQFEMATRHLWQMIGQQDINVKMAAIFAVASFPEYVIGLEQRIYHAIKNKNSRHHRWAFKLYTMLDKGLLPDVDALMEDPKFVGSLRDIQRELYKKRVDIFDGMTDEAQVRSSCAGYAVRFLP